MYRAPVLCGAVCLVVITVGGWLASSLVPEWVAQLTWVVLLTASSALCAYRDPKLGWQAGAAVMAVQGLGLFILLLVTGELFHPSTSTGGMVSLALGALFIALVSPVPILAAAVAALLRRRRDARAQTPTAKP